MLADPSAFVVINPIVQQSWLSLNNAEEGGGGGKPSSAGSDIAQRRCHAGWRQDGSCSKFKSMDSRQFAANTPLRLAIADVGANNDTNHHEPHHLLASLTMRPVPPLHPTTGARAAATQ